MVTPFAPHRLSFVVSTVASAAALALALPVATASAANPVESATPCSPTAGPGREAAAVAPILLTAQQALAHMHIPVYVHVLRTSKGGGVTDARIRTQIAVLNNAFAGRQSRL